MSSWLMADFVLPALAEAFLVKEDPPLVLGGHWWMLPREQGFISGCPVQHQSTKRHLGADAAQIRGRQSAPPAQIPAHSEGQGSQQKPTGFRCVLPERTRVTDCTWPP